jgi:hypothetical protein
LTGGMTTMAATAVPSRRRILMIAAPVAKAALLPFCCCWH